MAIDGLKPPSIDVRDVRQRTVAAKVNVGLRRSDSSGIMEQQIDLTSAVQLTTVT